jgi:hypothetical protein
MQPKKYILLISFIFTSTKCVFAQASKTPDQSYIQVEGDGLFIDKAERSANSKVTRIFIAGGSPDIRLTNAISKLSAHLYYHAYFKAKDLPGNSESAAARDVLFKDDGGKIYLNPDQEFHVDILDQRTDTLIKRYAIKRLRIIPDLKLTSQRGNNEFPLHFFSSGNYINQLKIPHGGEMNLSNVANNDLKNLEVEYTLVNLKTRKSEYKTLKNDFQTLRLAANTEYELRVNYVVQKESIGVCYIKVSPYWYQSALTYVIISIMIITLGFLSVTLLLKNKIRHSQKERQKLEQSAIRLQSLLNPHFTFNALSSIQGLMNTNRIEEANNYLQEFSSLLRQTLAKSQNLFNSLDQELEMMRMYIRLEALRFNFDWDIEVAAEINPTVIEIPTLLLQPLIENAIKHGLAALGVKGQMRIICKEGQEKSTLVIIVKDNGTWVDKSPGLGYGLSLTAERIQTINKMNKEQAIVLRFDKRSGTEAILTFNNWINN